jgi:hypothetical protein
MSVCILLALISIALEYKIYDLNIPLLVKLIWIPVIAFLAKMAKWQMTKKQS